MSRISVATAVNALLVVLSATAVLLFVFGGRDGAAANIARTYWERATIETTCAVEQCDFLIADATKASGETKIAIDDVSAGVLEPPRTAETAAAFGAPVSFEEPSFETESNVAENELVVDAELAFEADSVVEEEVALDADSVVEEEAAFEFDSVVEEEAAFNADSAVEDEIVFDGDDFGSELESTLNAELALDVDSVVEEEAALDAEFAFDADSVVEDEPALNAELAFDVDSVVEEEAAFDSEFAFDADSVVEDEPAFDADDFAAEPESSDESDRIAPEENSTSPTLGDVLSFDEATDVSADGATEPSVAEDSAEMETLVDSNEMALDGDDSASETQNAETNENENVASDADEVEPSTEVANENSVVLSTETAASEVEAPPTTSVASEPEPVLTTDLDAEENAVSAEPLADEFWIAGSNGRDFYFWLFDGANWVPKTTAEFFETDDPARPTIFWAHGFQTDMNDAAREGFAFRAVLDRARLQTANGRAYRLVVWKWASERAPRRLRKDAKEKAYLADYEGRKLGRLVAGLNPKTDVAFVGFSFGARLVGSALQTLATNGESGAPERRTSLILVSAGCDLGAFGRGGAYGAGALLPTDVLNAYNPLDFALKFYPCATDTRATALGVVPVASQNFPNAVARTTNLDLSGVLGKKHSFVDAIEYVPAERLSELAL